MITFTGRIILPDNDECPNELDIATGMCRITRYAGAIYCPLSAHSILVAELCYAYTKTDSDLARLSVWARGLLHDAHETVTGEVVGRWKTKETRALERNLDERLCGYFGINPMDLHAPIIHVLDQLALEYEAEILNLPGWAEYYRRFHPKYKGPPPEHAEIAQRVLNSEWMSSENVLAGSEKIKTLARALGFIRTKELDKARIAIEASY